MNKLKFLISMFLFLLPFLTLRAEPTETVRAERGLYRLMSADINEEDAYHFRTSIQYFFQSDLLKDTNESSIQGTEATLGFGYALLPQVHLNIHGGFRQIQQDPEVVSVGSVNPGTVSAEVVKAGAGITGTYDIGQWMNLKSNRLVAGLNLWINLSRITRFFSGPDIVPTLIVTGDFTDAELFPIRAHFNAGFRYHNSERYFESSDTSVRDFDRLATESFESSVIQAAIGFEFPFEYVNPSIEAHLQKPMDTGFSQAPKWVTIGLKGRPFPQKNIELFGAADFGLSTFKATSAASSVYPDSSAVPLWNAVLGFGISQFGRRAGEVGVDRREYEAVKQNLDEAKVTIAGLEKDLEFNVVKGRVIDAQTKKALAGVKVSMPENADFKASETMADGKFVRYFKALPGSRLMFSKDGYEASSKFLALQPGERVSADIELKKSSGENLADFVASILDEQGKPVAASVSLKNIETGEKILGTADPQGQLSLKVPEGRYLIEIRADGFRSIGDQVAFTRGKTVLRSFSLTTNK